MRTKKSDEMFAPPYIKSVFDEPQAVTALSVAGTGPEPLHWVHKLPSSLLQDQVRHVRTGEATSCMLFSTMTPLLPLTYCLDTPSQPFFSCSSRQDQFSLRPFA